MTEKTLDQRFAEALGQLIGPDFPKTIGLAVSGGGDSMAMLALAHAWARVWGVQLSVATVDHGLRSESADEAAMVARECAELGHPHRTLRWEWNGKGNVQDQARRARLRLLSEWCDGFSHVLMGHTADDVAETFLIRLARGSGVDGLSAMTPRRNAYGFEIIRPCLEMTRDELRHYVDTLHMPYVDDPSNEDPKFERVKARQMLPKLADLGLTTHRLRDTAKRLSRASEGLRARAVEVADRIACDASQGVVRFDRASFQAVERETQMRLMAAACMWVSGAEYRPRVASLENLLDRLLAGGSGTLLGAKAETSANVIFVFRELRATQGQLSFSEGRVVVWDHRWEITGSGKGWNNVRALGEDVKIIENWREFGLPRAALMALPAIWSGDDLICAPTLEQSDGWQARIAAGFRSYL